MEIEQNKLEQLNLRIQNLKVVIQVAQMEIAELLEEIDKLQHPKKIGFRLSTDIDVKKTSNKRTPSNKPMS
jgi:FtsZ-binding cell division protein ZapB